MYLKEPNIEFRVPSQLQAFYKNVSERKEIISIDRIECWNFDVKFVHDMTHCYSEH